MEKNLFYYCLVIFSICLHSNCSEKIAEEDLVGIWETYPESATEMVWESSAPIVVNNFSLTTPQIAEISTQYANVLLPEKVRSVFFRKDKKVEVSYLDDNGYLTSGIFGTYKLNKRQMFIFTPDVDKFSGSLDLLNSITHEGINVMAKTGIPVKYQFIGNDTKEIQFVLNTTTLKESKYLFPLLAISILGKDANDATVKGILESTPAHLEKTSMIEIRFNYYKPYSSGSK